MQPETSNVSFAFASNVESDLQEYGMTREEATEAQRRNAELRVSFQNHVDRQQREKVEIIKEVFPELHEDQCRVLLNVCFVVLNLTCVLGLSWTRRRRCGETWCGI